MSLADLIRGKVALASDLTRDLQPTVMIKAWIGADGFGVDSYATPVAYQALVDTTRQQKYTSTGRLVMTLAIVYFLDIVAPNGTVTQPERRQEPIDPRDIIILPDGTTAPIVDIKGFWDAGAGRPFFNTVTLGQILK